MKKLLRPALSLALALILCAALMLPAAAASYTDDNEIEFTESVDVMSSLGIINGYENADGSYSFKPQAPLKREEAAKILAYIAVGIRGLDELSGFYNSDCPLTDIESSWARDYIAYCYSESIINGFDGGLFCPEQELSIAQCAKLLLSAAGYNSDGRYTGDGWSQNAMTDAASAGLFDEMSVSPETIDGSRSCTREFFCSMAFMTIQNVLQKDKDTTLGGESFGIVGTVTGAVTSVSGGTATFSGELTSGALRLVINADGSAAIETVSTSAPIELKLPASNGLSAGVVFSFGLKTEPGAEFDRLRSKLPDIFEPRAGFLQMPVCEFASIEPETVTVSQGKLIAQADVKITDVSSNYIKLRAGDADFDSFRVRGSVALLENGNPQVYITANEAIKYCAENPDAMLGIYRGYLTVITLEKKQPTLDFPAACLYFGEYGVTVTADRTYYELELFAEGRKEYVRVDYIVLVDENDNRTVYELQTQEDEENLMLLMEMGRYYATCYGDHNFICPLRLTMNTDGDVFAYVYSDREEDKLYDQFENVYTVDYVDDDFVALKNGEDFIYLTAGSGFCGIYDLTQEGWPQTELKPNRNVIAFWRQDDEGNYYLWSAYVVSPIEDYYPS